MPDPEEKDAAARFGAPLSAGGKVPDASIKSRETVRIQLPVRDARDAASTQFSRPPNPSSADQVIPASGSLPLEPKKETVRVSPALVPHPPAVRLKDNQPFHSVPEIASHNLLGSIAPTEKNPMLLRWILLVVSALILIIQIWTYLS